MYLLQRFIKYIFAILVSILLLVEMLDLLGFIPIEKCVELAKNFL